MKTLSKKAIEARVRRRCARVGLTLVSVSPRSPDFPDYGPYYLVDRHDALWDCCRPLAYLARHFNVVKRGEVVA